MTEVSGEQILNLQKECDLLREENLLLKASSGWLDKESFRNDNSKAKFQTGLPSFSVLLTLFT